MGLTWVILLPTMLLLVFIFRFVNPSFIFFVSPPYLSFLFVLLVSLPCIFVVFVSEQEATHNGLYHVG